MAYILGQWEFGFSGDNAASFLKGVCPHCDVATVFSVPTSSISTTAKNGKITVHLIIKCNFPGCGKLTYMRVGKSQNSSAVDWVETVPSGNIKEPHEAIPQPVASDWLEAQKASSIGAVKAAAVMCRRVLYGVLLDRKCKEHPLHEAIEELLQKEPMPGIVREWLNEIKDDGHDAAHPYRALDVPAENVAETLEYTRELLRFVYIEPHDLAARLARKAAKPTP